jgi:integrase
MAIEKLSASEVARISKPGKYGDGNGLYLYASKNLAKSWIFRYQFNHAEHYMGLGPLSAVSIKEARVKVRKARALLAKKINPLQTHVAPAGMAEAMNKKNGMTFDECAITYIKQHRYGWKSDKHYQQWKSSLRTYASPHFGSMLVHEVATEHILQALEPIWIDKTETAFRLRERIERILAWATIKGYREGDNPARWKGYLQELLPKPSRIKTVRHHPSLPYQEIGAFFKLLNTQESIRARALKFIILTVCRTSEALYARWQEIDFVRRVWIIPPERMKNGRLHRVPFSEAVLKVLHAQAGLHPDWVFPNPKTGKPYSESVLLDLLRSLGYTEATVHGFRAAFRIWAAEAGYPKDIAEMALAHKQASAVEEAYQRSDLFERRRVLMQKWENVCVITHPPA